MSRTKYNMYAHFRISRKDRHVAEWPENNVQHSKAVSCPRTKLGMYVGPDDEETYLFIAWHVWHGSMRCGHLLMRSVWLHPFRNGYAVTCTYAP